MSVNIYPAHIDADKHVVHADNWEDESTLNIANGNFYWLTEAMGIDKQITEVPGTMKLKALEEALDKSPHTGYTERLRKICAIARIKRVNLIAFS